MVDLNLILELLVFGSKGIANAALKDLYEQWKSLIKIKISAAKIAETISPEKLLKEYEQNPNRWRQVLSDTLDEAKVSEDEEISEITAALSGLIQSRQHTTASQDFRNENGTQINIGNTAIGNQSNVYNQHGSQQEFVHEVKNGIRTVYRFDPVTQSFSVVGSQLV